MSHACACVVLLSQAVSPPPGAVRRAAEESGGGGLYAARYREWTQRLYTIAEDATTARQLKVSG